MDEPILQLSTPAIEDIPKSAINPFETLIERNKSIIKQYTDGVLIKVIALNHGISEPQVYNIVRKHPGIVLTNREAEKNRRIRRLRLCETKAPKNLAPKNVSDLVAVIKAQDDLERPDPLVSIDNRSVTINTPADFTELKSIASMMHGLMDQLSSSDDANQLKRIK